MVRPKSRRFGSQGNSSLHIFAKNCWASDEMTLGGRQPSMTIFAESLALPVIECNVADRIQSARPRSQRFAIPVVNWIAMPEL
jgi:hypothetical protein